MKKPGTGKHRGTKRRLRLTPGLIIAILSVVALDLSSETLNFTAYYPAPTGAYNLLSTLGKTILARNGGGVGVGTASPRSALDVKGTLAVNGRAALTKDDAADSHVWMMDNAPDDRLRIFDQPGMNVPGTERLTITSSGDLGIATSHPDARLHVNGNILSEGNRVYLGAKDPNTWSWLMAGGTDEPDKNALGFNAANHTISVGPAWTLLAGGKVMTGSYVGTGGSQNIAVTGISASRPIRALVIIQTASVTWDFNQSIIIKTDTMPGTEHYINGQPSDYRDGQGGGEDVTLTSTGFRVGFGQHLSWQGKVYHYFALAG